MREFDEGLEDNHLGKGIYLAPPDANYILTHQERQQIYDSRDSVGEAELLHVLSRAEIELKNHQTALVDYGADSPITREKLELLNEVW
eukprot:CAMPEP_0115013090 /NCGR_PEP_ID=MMETSP0216-20121206/25176_1 /TAXON_ID=223996 /ORGANISM="Protocruzia adherens, Strain Boccale" /LENGTH=87 /DNA_ID=CAMNT_0002382373 /DNA_START=616 /DNA_END=876 /DNA_ORIENTATION=-